MRVLYKLVFAILMLSTVVASGSGMASAQPATTPLDLPATVLTPGDAELIGISGLGRFENGHFRSLEEYSAIRSEFLNLPLEDVRSAMTEAGYLQGYTSNLGIPAEPGNPESPPSRVVFSSIYEYATEEGASAAFAFNTTQYAGVTVANVDATITPSAPFGDEMIMTRTTSATMEEEGPSDQVDAVFRVGVLVIGTGIIEYGMTVDEITNPGPIDPALVSQVEQLADRIVERIKAAQSGSVPNLSGMSLSLTAAGADSNFTSEGYRRIDGEDIPYYNGYQDNFADVVTEDAIAAYEVAQGLGGLDGDPFDPFYANRLFQFATEEDASAFLAAAVDIPGARVELVPDVATALGPEAKVLQYDVEVGPGLVALGYQVNLRVGSTVATLLLESADHRPDLQVVLDLAALQAACLTGECADQQLPATW